MLTSNRHDFNREVRDGPSSVRLCSPVAQTGAIPYDRISILVTEICLSKIELNAERNTKRTNVFEKPERILDRGSRRRTRILVRKLHMSHNSKSTINYVDCPYNRQPHRPPVSVVDLSSGIFACSTDPEPSRRAITGDIIKSRDRSVLLSTCQLSEESAWFGIQGKTLRPQKIQG